MRPPQSLLQWLVATPVLHLRRLILLQVTLQALPQVLLLVLHLALHLVLL